MKKSIKQLFTVVCMLFFITPVFSQKITFTLYDYNPCNDEVKPALLFFIRDKDGHDYPMEEDGSGRCFLKDTGTYTVVDEYGASYKYVFNEYKSYVDTTRVLVIEELYTPGTIFQPGFAAYYCCDERCEGEQIDYYSNGNKRLEGKFKDGIPIGKVYAYYSNGNLYEVKKYNRKGYLKTTYYYDKNGKLIEKERND